MTSESELPLPVKNALRELKRTIRQRYPDVSFDVGRGIDDPGNVYLFASVDIDDPDEVVDLVIDRVMELQLEDVPVNVGAVYAPYRVAEAKRRAAARRRADSSAPSPAGSV